MGLGVGDGYRLQAAVDYVADCQQELAQAERHVDQQLFLDFYQQVLVRQFQWHRHGFIGFTELIDHFFHGLHPLALMTTLRFIP